MTGSERAARLGAHIGALTEAGPRDPDNPPGIAAALDYLTSTLASYGYQAYQHHYGEQDHQVNVIVEPGADQGGGTLDLGAHWDTVAGSPGADDNASGVAGLLEIAREFAADPPARPVRLCFFAEEEAGGLPGSTTHVEAFVQRGEKVAAAMVLEMIGYCDRRPGSQQLPQQAAQLLESAGVAAPDRGDFIALVGDTAAGELVLALRDAAEQLEPELPTMPLVVPAGALGDGARSDHAAYWRAGIPGLMITDTANFRNPHYHRPTDTPGTLDLDFAAQVTTMVIAAVRGSQKP
ncbi:M20/M25/M40 family metallo-hydrolase [Nesterenkonia muleiensis]|uniref:M20/M25/M40 family metallo-hydrolase n=1 Tax=Nesterenkonia muleiensis TaxID=2282648 RepID=UPI000E7327B1|nr:M20/M25/M40 family metallo-hydrolase [Nesterenkonia muleiensis]